MKAGLFSKDGILSTAQKIGNFTYQDGFTLNNQSEKRKEIWAIGGGKGGVGKSLTTANLSICLALLGHKVVTIDLDLGGANLHTCLGAKIPQATLSDYLGKKLSHFSDLLSPTPIDNLKIISGAHDDFGMANLKQAQKGKILYELDHLDSDFILLDLGAGTTFNTLDFFLSADRGIMTTLPEPTSIENTYRFIKSIYHRKLKLCEDLIDIHHLIDQAMNSKISDTSNPAEMIQKMSLEFPEKGQIIKREIEEFTPGLIINQVRSQNDIDIGFSMKYICRKYFGFNLDFLGYLEYDASVWQSVKKRKPLLTTFPNSNLVNNFDQIVQNLVGKKGKLL